MNQVSVAALRQYGGNGVANAAARRRKQSVTSEGRRPGWVSYAILTAVILISIVPLYYAVSIASQDSTATQFGARAMIPGSSLWRNLSTAFGLIEFWRAFGGTVLVSTVCAASTVLFSTLAGYSFSKLRFRGRGPLLLFVIGTMAIPTQLAVVPLYIMIGKWMGLFGSLWPSSSPAWSRRSGCSG